jgi:hypothetical protein
MQRPSYPDPTAWGRPEGELRPWIWYKYNNFHAEAVLSGPHRLRTARRRAEAINLVKVKKLTCRGRHIRTPSLEDGQRESWGHEFGKRKKILHAEAVISGPHCLSTARRRAEAMNLLTVQKLTCRGRHIRIPRLEGRPEGELRPLIW